jgi:hypothetical protein
VPHELSEACFDLVSVQALGTGVVRHRCLGSRRGVPPYLALQFPLVVVVEVLHLEVHRRRPAAA